MTRLLRLILRLRPALLCASGAAALMTTGAQAQSDCMDQIDALRAAAADAPQSVNDEAAFREALGHAEGWYEQGDRNNCQGWVDEAEALLAEPEPEPEPEDDRSERTRAQAEREADRAAEDARDRAREARERAEARAEEARQQAQERREAARERMGDGRRDAGNSQSGEAGEAREPDDAQTDRRSAEQRNGTGRTGDRDGWRDRWLDDDDRTDGAVDAAGAEDASRDSPAAVDGARDRLQVIEPRSSRETDAPAGFTASVDRTVSPATPAASEISALERSARRRLVAGPDTTLAEINARGASGQRRFAGGDRAYGARAARAPSDRTDPAVTVKTVRFEPETAEITADIREAVKTAASARDGGGVIAVRGDSFDARFRARANRLIQALAEEGVSRSDIEVMWGRSYADTPDRLELAVMPQGRRY